MCKRLHYSRMIRLVLRSVSRRYEPPAPALWRGWNRDSNRNRLIIARFSPTMRPARLVRRWILLAFTRREHRQSRMDMCRWGCAIYLPPYIVVLRRSEERRVGKG